MQECDFPPNKIYRADNNFIALNFAENNVQEIQLLSSIPGC